MEEADARTAIVEWCALLWRRRLVYGSSGNVSVRLKNGDIMVTPAARSLRALLAEELIVVDPSGAPRPGQGKPTSELPLHVAAYRACPKAQSLIHTHPTYCIAWSRARCVFPRDTVGARETLGNVQFVGYAPPGSEELAQATQRAFASGADVVLMEDHGVSAIGGSLEQCFIQTDLAEQTAHLALLRRNGE